MPNYAKLAATAKRLIEKSGRNLTLRKRATAPADAAKPWRGPGVGGDTDVTVKGVVLLDQLIPGTSDIVRRELQELRKARLALVASESAPGVDLKGYTVLIDGATTYEITECELIQPGDTKVLWKLRMKL